MSLKADRELGQTWEENFCALAERYEKSYTPLQIGRMKSAIAYHNHRHYTLPDVTVWSHPGEHHEIKHKTPTKYNSFGLEVYRFNALLWFAQETKQDVMYTIHDYSIYGNRKIGFNFLRDWLTIKIVDLDKEWIGPYRGPSYVNGIKKIVPIYYWPKELWEPLGEYWGVE